MAKRFTDTNKWLKESFGQLSLKMKLVWVYLCDNCDHAGIWDANFKLLTFHLGEETTREEITAAFGDKVCWLGMTKLFIPAFVEFQYSCSLKDLNPENKVHFSVINSLKKYGAIKGLARPMQGAKDKDKNKDKDKDKEEIQLKSAQDLIDFLPTDLKKNWINEFDEDWLISEIGACHEYYTLTRPDKKPKTEKGWRSAAGGWIRRSRNKVLKLQRNAGDISPGVA